MKTAKESDKQLRDAVLRQLEWDPQVTSNDINVATADGVVTLTGVVRHRVERSTEGGGSHSGKPFPIGAPGYFTFISAITGGTGKAVFCGTCVTCASPCSRRTARSSLCRGRALRAMSE